MAGGGVQNNPSGIRQALMQTGQTGEQRYYLLVAWQSIHKHLVAPNDLPAGSYTLTADIAASSSGRVQSASILTSSGNVGLDQAMLTAIMETRNLPPTGHAYHGHFSMTFLVEK